MFSLLLASFVQFLLSERGGLDLGSILGIKSVTEFEGLSCRLTQYRFFAVPLARQALVYAAVSAFWHYLESLRWFFVAIQLFFCYFLAQLDRDDGSLRSRVRCLGVLEIEVLTIGAFLWTARFGVILMNGSA